MMATVMAINLGIQLHDGSNILLNIERRIPRNTVHLLYCGLQIDNNRGNRYDALLPIISSSNNPPIVRVAANTQTSVSEYMDNGFMSSQSTLVSDPDFISLSSSSNESTI